MKLRTILHTLLNLPKKYLIGGAIVILLLLIGGLYLLRHTAPTTTTISSVSHVQVASVASLSSQTGPLEVTGKVTSLSDATILAQTSGEIVSLPHSLGDFVNAGDIIGSFDSSSQEAALVQAQGAYAAAEASLAEASGTSAQNSGISATQAAQNVQNTQTAASAAIQSAYAAMDDAVHTKADELFSNPRTASAQLLITVPNSELVETIVNERIQLEGTLMAAEQLATTSTNANTDADIQTMAADIQLVETFLTNLITAVNETQPSASVSAATLAGYQSSLAAARTEVVGAYTSLTGAKSSYDSAVLNAATASNSAGSGTSNGIAIAEANVQEALGSLDAAQAALEKTLIRSPISGTIVSLPITLGDYVSSFSEVAEVSNPAALYIDAEVTPSDAATIAVGNTATINDTTNGIVTFIAPALDPTTEEIEVKIGIDGDQSALTDGDTVDVQITRTPESTTSVASANSSSIIIPINAAKITPTGPLVFTVSATSTLVAHSIVLGTILGNQVTVVSGLTPDMDIVTDARGLAEGQTVIVDAP